MVIYYELGTRFCHCMIGMFIYVSLEINSKHPAGHKWIILIIW